MKLHIWVLMLCFCVSTLVVKGEEEDFITDYVYPLGDTSFIVLTSEEWKIWDISQNELQSFPEPLSASAYILGMNQGILCCADDGKVKLISAQEKLPEPVLEKEDGFVVPVIAFRGCFPISWKGCNYWGRLCYRKKETVQLYIQLRDLKTFQRIHEFDITNELIKALSDNPFPFNFVGYRLYSAPSECVILELNNTHFHCFKFCNENSALIPQWYAHGEMAFPIFFNSEGTIFWGAADLSCEKRDFKTGKLLDSFSLPEKEYNNIYQCEHALVSSTDTHHPFIVTYESGIFKIYDGISFSETPLQEFEVPPDFPWEAIWFNRFHNMICIHGNQFYFCNQSGGFVVDMKTGKILRQTKFHKETK